MKITVQADRRSQRHGRAEWECSMRYAIRLRAAGKRQHLLSGVNSWPCSRRLHSARFGSVEDAVDALATIVRQFPGDFDSCQVLDGDKVIRRWSPAKGHVLIWDLADAVAS